jgi:hypothetical protein
MNRLIRIVLTSYMAITFFTAGIIGVSRRIPELEIISGLHSCNNELCYENIVLGKTKWEDVKDILLNIPGAILSTSFLGVETPHGPIHRIIAFPSDDKTVMEIDFVLRTEAIKVVDVITYLGTPCAIYYNDQHPNYPHLIILSYPNAAIWVSTDNWDLNFSSYVGQIDLGYPLLLKTATTTGFIKPCAKTIDTNYPFLWKGFRRYLN